MHHELVHENGKPLILELFPEGDDELLELILVDTILEVHDQVNSSFARYGCDCGKVLPIELLVVDLDGTVFETPLTSRYAALGSHHLVDVDNSVSLFLMRRQDLIRNFSLAKNIGYLLRSG